jgi:adenylate cyclase
MTQLRRALRNPAVASLILGVGVFAIVAAVRQFGLLQSAEFLVYDKFLTWRAGPETTDPRIVIVEISESDINKYDFPIPDDLLARLLETIARARPTTIGLDLYRDLAVPRDGSRLAELNRVLRQNQNIVGIFKFGDEQHPINIAFAPALAETQERYGFNDLPFELGAVRRGFLFLWDNQGNVYPSFALTLALQAGVTARQEASAFRIGKTVFPRFRSNNGAYVRAQDGGYQFLLDFKGPRKFVTYSLDDVLSQRVDEQIWRDKIVLIGERAESAHDFETTPLQTRVPGVELNAQVFNQLLRAAEQGDKPTASWSESVESSWIFAFCLIGAAIGFFVRRPILSLTAGCLVIAVLTAICWIAFTRDLWLPFVPALDGNALAAAAVTGYMRQVERKDREIMRGLFSRHLSADVAQSIWERRDEFMAGNRPRPQQLTVTVLFTDLRNFSTTTESLEPSEAMDWINEYMQALAQHVGRRGGVVNKYIGDSIMGVFGFPIPRNSETEVQRDAINAVTCALDMSSEIQNLNQKWTQTGRPAAQMRVGIFTGRAVAGCVGSKDRLEFTVIGDTVNTASRLESFDKEYAIEDPCRILIGQSTFDRVNGQFATEFVQTIELKGKAQKTTIYRVLGSNT